MTKNKRPPFHNLGMEAWQNLAMLALCVLYIFQIAWSINSEGLLGNAIGLDFRAYWSAGYIANKSGYAQAYNLTLLKDVQKQIVPHIKNTGTFEVVPAPLLPLFIIPFQLLALFPPITSFYIWSVLNLIGFVLYLRFFFHKLDLPGWPRFIFLGLLAFPSFQNLFWGQINLLLVICVGEFVRHWHDNREFEAGLWLGGLILKPQLLILIGPIFLLRRVWKLLGGFSTTILIVIGSSLLLGGWSSLINLVILLTKYIPGVATNAPENMMNWRMVGGRLSSFLPPAISWGIASAGMLGTLLITFFLWHKPLSFSSPVFLVAFTGTLAATLVLTWHSHIHMAMVMILPSLYLFATKMFSQKLFNWWMLGLPFIILLLDLTVGLLGLDQYNALPGLTGLCILIFNLIILGWAVRAVRLKELS